MKKQGAVSYHVTPPLWSQVIGAEDGTYLRVCKLKSQWRPVRKQADAGDNRELTGGCKELERAGPVLKERQLLPSRNRLNITQSLESSNKAKNLYF